MGIGEFDRALAAARAGRYDFSYRERIPAEFRYRAPAFASSAGRGLA
jgi:hypothetical protein